MSADEREAADRRDEAIARGLAAVAENPEPEEWFYASFVDTDGDQFIGGVYVRGATVEAALTRATLLGINPGGEVMTVGPLSAADMDAASVPVEQRERLLSRAEVEA